MLKGAKLNFGNDAKFKRDGFKCDFCPAISSQNHMIYTCEEFEKFRFGRSLEKDEDLCHFLADVMQYRLNIDDIDF